MWWLVLVALVVIVVVAFPLRRAASARRERSRQWNDLRQRRQLIATQLRQLQEATDRRDATR